MATFLIMVTESPTILIIWMAIVMTLMTLDIWSCFPTPHGQMVIRLHQPHIKQRIYSRFATKGVMGGTPRRAVRICLRQTLPFTTSLPGTKLWMRINLNKRCLPYSYEVEKIQLLGSLDEYWDGIEDQSKPLHDWDLLEEAAGSAGIASPNTSSPRKKRADEAGSIHTTYSSFF